MPRDKEDGELSDESPKSSEVKDHEDFIIDKSFTEIIPDEDLKDSADKTPSAEKKPSDWQKQMRKRLLDESVSFYSLGMFNKDYCFRRTNQKKPRTSDGV